MSGPNGDPEISIENSIIEDEDYFSEEEYASINSMLDQINSCLDDLEDRNDALNGKLHELLESNRQARQDFRDQMGSTPAHAKEQAPLERDPTDGELGRE